VRHAVQSLAVWDVAIVGAGPAGSAAALAIKTAQPSVSVILLDRSDFPRDKACGDGIAPHVLDVLADVGVSGLVNDRVPLRQLELRQGRRATVARLMARPAYVVPRALLDSRIVEAAVSAGAMLRRHRVRSVHIGSERADLDGQIHAKLVIGSDGASSSVRRALGLTDTRSRQALGIRGYGPTPQHRRGRQVIAFGRGPQPAYAWAFDRGDGSSNVGYGELLSSRRPAPTRTYLKGELERLLPGSTAKADDWLGHHLPLSSSRWRHPDGVVMLAGDAAGLVNPMTGEGIYYAVATGVLAGRAAVGALAAGNPAVAGARYRDAVRSLLARHLRHTAAGSRLLAVPAITVAAIRAAARDQRVFDDLVEVGLGRGLLTPRVLRSAALQLPHQSR
jgi:menaquinone-9 beta-reductase